MGSSKPPKKSAKISSYALNKVTKWVSDKGQGEMLSGSRILGCRHGDRKREEKRVREMCSSTNFIKTLELNELVNHIA